MKNDKYLPYNMDFKFEYKTHRNIGEKCRIKFKAKSNKFYKIYYEFRNFINKGESVYKEFDTYSQWEFYVKNKYGKNIGNNDFIHFLKYKRRISKHYLDIWKSVATPMYICLIALGGPVLEKDPFALIGFILIGLIAVFILVILLVRCYTLMSEYYFCRDLIKILEQNIEK